MYVATGAAGIVTLTLALPFWVVVELVGWEDVQCEVEADWVVAGAFQSAQSVGVGGTVLVLVVVVDVVVEIVQSAHCEGVVVTDVVVEVTFGTDEVRFQSPQTAGIVEDIKVVGVTGTEVVVMVQSAHV